jgi:ABC-type sugar transport system permease subunit
MNKTQNNKAWFLVLPVFLLVAFSAIVPLMTVVNYSVQDILDSSTRFFVGVEWFREVLHDSRLHDSLLRQFIFSFFVLAIEIPLGICVALMMPKKGVWSSLCLNAVCDGFEGSLFVWPCICMSTCMCACMCLRICRSTNFRLFSLGLCSPARGFEHVFLDMRVVLYRFDVFAVDDGVAAAPAIMWSRSCVDVVGRFCGQRPNFR